MDFAFLHGGGQGSWVWARTIEAMQLQSQGASHSMLALDVPGCGAKRDRDTAQLSMNDIASELIADIETAGLRDVVLIGHSQGGQAMPEIAALRPDLFRRFVYVACSIPLPGQTVIDMIGAGAQGTNDTEVGWPFDPAETAPEARAALMFCNDMSADETAHFLSLLGKDMWPPQTYAMTNWRYDGVGLIPSSFVTCLQDAILPVAWQDVFAERFQTKHHYRIDAGHQAMWTAPHALAEALLKDAQNTA